MYLLPFDIIIHNSKSLIKDRSLIYVFLQSTLNKREEDMCLRPVRFIVWVTEFPFQFLKKLNSYVWKRQFLREITTLYVP